MRRLMLFAMGFAFACAVGVYLISGIWLLVLCASFIAAFFAMFLIRTSIGRKVACVLLGCVFGFFWLWCFDWGYLKPARQMDGSTQWLSVEVMDYSTVTEYGITADGKIKLDGKTYSIQFYLDQEITLSPGDKVEGGFRLRYTGGGNENATYHRGNGIFLLGYPKGEHQITNLETVPAKYFAPVLRQKILTRIAEVFPEDTQDFASALLIGETSGLSYRDRSALKTSGIYHVVAVSGMHVSILFAFVSLLCLRRRFLTALIGWPVLFLFAAVAGFTPSIVRACIMQALMILALLVDKEYDQPTALAAAVLVILAVNPISITSVSFQLSVGCIIGILLFSQRIHEYFLERIGTDILKGKSLRARIYRWIVASTNVTLGAMSVTVPFTAIYFGNISLCSIITNLLTLWLVSLVFYGVVAACLFGAIWIQLGCGIGWLFSWPIRFIVWVSNMISNIPLSAVYTNSIYIILWLVFSYVLITIFIKSKKKHPFVLIACLLVGLVGSVACTWIEPRMDDYRITAVDVGQGQCLLLQSQGKYYMVDCGGDSDDAAADRATQLLFSQGVFHLDGVVVTHYDADHAGGVNQVLSRVGAEKIYLPVFGGDDPIRDAIAQEYADTIVWVQDTISIPLPNGSLTIYPSDVTDDDNECSLCILFQPEDCDILITGDRSEAGERALLEYTDIPDLEILVAGHHGSRTSTSWELLNATRPEIVIISVGEDNSYGHPSWEALERIELFGSNVYRTDKEGTIVFRG